MRLISKEKDYYDFYAYNRGLSDQTRIWERKTKLVRLNYARPKGFTHRLQKIGDWETSVVGFHICFCGGIIPVVCVESGTYTDRKEDFYYKASDIPDFIKKQTKHLMLWDGFKTYENFFATVILEEKTSTGMILPKIPVVDLHRQLNSPVFVDAKYLHEDFDKKLKVFQYGRGDSFDVFADLCLDVFDFKKYMDAFSCFRTLERFINNDLVVRDTKCDIKIPDVIKAESKGFDKFSFRKDKKE